jgi:hypothetical protein
MARLALFPESILSDNSYVRTSSNMNYRHLSLRCQCGEIPDRIAEVGFTDDHSMVIHWWCTNCKKVVYVTKSLSECWRECPSPSHSLDRVLAKAGDGFYEGQDAEFLRSIGVQA